MNCNLLVSSQDHLVTEKKEEHPAAMNAFELISMSKGLNLGNLFDSEQVCMLEGLLYVVMLNYIFKIDGALCGCACA